MGFRRCSVVLVLALLLAACGGGSSGDLSIIDPRIGEPTGPNAALYLTVETDGSDRLLGASTDVASRVEIHETEMADDGTMTMTPVEGLDVGADAALVLEPGGKHLMLVEAQRLQAGETVEVTLRFQDAGEITIDAEVISPQDALRGMDGDAEGHDMSGDG